MSSDEYHLYLRGPDRKRVLDLSDYTTLTLVPNFNDGSKWSVDLPATSKALDEVDVGYGLIVEHEGEEDPVLSGNAKTLLETTDDKGTTKLTLSGVDDTAKLADLQVLPCPPSGTTGTVFAGADYYTPSGGGEAVLRAAVNANAISLGFVPGLINDTSTGLGTSVSEKARFGSLMTLLQDVATHTGGLGFRIVQQSGSTDLVFKVYQPVDRSGTVIFSKAFGNLQSSSFQTQAPTCNYVIVAGGGDLAARVFVILQDTDSIARWGVIQDFVDQRQTSDIGLLTQAGQAALTNGAEKSSASIVPTLGSGLRYGRDFRVGDIARADVKVDKTIIDVIRQATITVKPGEDLIVRPVIGNSQATDPGVPSFFKQGKVLNNRVISLEAS